MITLERIVRPFQTPDITPPRRALSSNAKEPENLTIRIGLNGTGKNLSGSYSWTQSKYMDKRHKEWFLDRPALNRGGGPL